jgi:hypothetical protein
VKPLHFSKPPFWRIWNATYLGLLRPIAINQSPGARRSRAGRERAQAQFKRG